MNAKNKQKSKASALLFCSSPLDIDMSKARIDKILEVLKPEVVITSNSVKEQFEIFEFKRKILIYEEVGAKKFRPIVEKVKSRILDTNLLYVLFTFGSTGTPKGVGITHRSVIDYTDWVVETFEITSEDSFRNQALFYFDNSILNGEKSNQYSYGCQTVFSWKFL